MSPGGLTEAVTSPCNRPDPGCKSSDLGQHVVPRPRDDDTRTAPAGGHQASAFDVATSIDPWAPSRPVARARAAPGCCPANPDLVSCERPTEYANNGRVIPPAVGVLPSRSVGRTEVPVVCKATSSAEDNPSPGRLHPTASSPAALLASRRRLLGEVSVRIVQRR